jgi:hypothetical protein
MFQSEVRGAEKGQCHLLNVVQAIPLKVLIFLPAVHNWSLVKYQNRRRQ